MDDDNGDGVNCCAEKLCVDDLLTSFLCTVEDSSCKISNVLSDLAKIRDFVESQQQVKGQTETIWTTENGKGDKKRLVRKFVIQIIIGMSTKWYGMLSKDELEKYVYSLLFLEDTYCVPGDLVWFATRDALVQAHGSSRMSDSAIKTCELGKIGLFAAKINEHFLSNTSRFREMFIETENTSELMKCVASMPDLVLGAVGAANVSRLDNAEILKVHSSETFFFKFAQGIFVNKTGGTRVSAQVRGAIASKMTRIGQVAAITKVWALNVDETSIFFDFINDIDSSILSSFVLGVLKEKSAKVSEDQRRLILSTILSAETLKNRSSPLFLLACRHLMLGKQRVTGPWLWSLIDHLDSIDDNLVFEIACFVAEVWSRPAYTQNIHIDVHRYCTGALLTLLALDSVSSKVEPKLVPPLLQGVQNHLASGVSDVRCLGMLVGQAFAKSARHPGQLEFDELRQSSFILEFDPAHRLVELPEHAIDEDKGEKEDKQEEPEESKPKMSKEEIANRKTTLYSAWSDEDSSNESSSDSDDDSELESLSPLQQKDSSKTRKAANFIRDIWIYCERMIMIK